MKQCLIICAFVVAVSCFGACSGKNADGTSPTANRPMKITKEKNKPADTLAKDTNRRKN